MFSWPWLLIVSLSLSVPVLVRDQWQNDGATVSLTQEKVLRTKWVILMGDVVRANNLNHLFRWSQKGKWRKDKARRGSVLHERRLKRYIDRYNIKQKLYILVTHFDDANEQRVLGQARWPLDLFRLEWETKFYLNTSIWAKCVLYSVSRSVFPICSITPNKKSLLCQHSDHL